MRPSVAVAMIVCGAGLISLALINNFVFMHAAAKLLSGPGANNVDILHHTEPFFQWFAAIMGTAMIVLALVQSRCSAKSSQ
jgi:hypothetical protein